MCTSPLPKKSEKEVPQNVLFFDICACTQQETYWNIKMATSEYDYTDNNSLYTKTFMYVVS